MQANMRRIVSILLAVMFCVACFTGCGSSKDNGGTASVDVRNAKSIADLAGAKIAAQTGTFHADALEQIPGIVKIRADEAVSNGFITVRNIASVISAALIAILLVVSVFIISNTIKLTTFDRRDEIAIMKMVGATNGFIRWPFVFEGLLIGLCGAIVAFFLQWLLYAGVAQGIANSDTLQLLKVVAFQKIWLPVAVVFGGVGILVGVGGSLTAIRKFLQV